MALQDDIRLRLSANAALLTHVTPGLRAVSVDVVPEQKRAWLRFIFDGKRPSAEQETASCASTEILSDYADDWDMDTDIVYTPARSNGTPANTGVPSV